MSITTDPLWSAVAASITFAGSNLAIDKLAPRRHHKSLQSLALATTAFALYAVLYPETTTWFLNPWRLTPLYWFVAYVVKCVLLSVLDWFVDAVVAMTNPKRLKFRVNYPDVKGGLPKLEWIDYLFLAINSAIEFVFTCHVFHHVFDSPRVTYELKDLSLLNTVPALYLLFMVDDMIYAPAHKLMHWRPLYPFIHKHHHRQNLPQRGYLDAGNEHPLEQIIGQGILWVTILIVERITGLHFVTIFVHFAFYAALAVLNHTSYDINFRFFGFQYSVGCHEMHHRHPTCNMAQYFMFWDVLMQTYSDYVSELDGVPDNLKNKRAQKKCS